MNWFQQNRFLGTFLAALGVGTLACLIFLWLAKSHFDEGKAQFDQQANELAALQRHNPYPSDANLRKMKTQAEDYAGQLNVVKEELKTHVLAPPADMKPNEFQARLRQAMASVSDKARSNKVKLPENFFLGFDEFAAALPETAAAPLLGQQLAQVELLMNLLLDSHVAEVTSLARAPQTLLPATGPSPTPSAKKPNATAAATPIVEWAAFDVALTASPSAARRALNQISTNNQQLYVIRTLQVLNEKEKGPPREAAGAAAATANPAPPKPGASPGAGVPALNFIVGEERVRVSARVEMLRFSF